MHFVDDPERAMRSGEAAFDLFPRMIALAHEAGLPAEDIEFIGDTCRLIALARRYYCLPFDPALPPVIEAAKQAYKARWPRPERQRYRIKTSFEPFRVKRRTLAWAAALLLRKRRRYRIIDRLFTLGLLGILYCLLRPAAKNSLPKFLRKSAMGIDTLFK